MEWRVLEERDFPAPDPEMIYEWDLSELEAGLYTLRLYMTSTEDTYAERKIRVLIDVPTPTPTPTETPLPTPRLPLPQCRRILHSRRLRARPNHLPLSPSFPRQVIPPRRRPEA